MLVLTMEGISIGGRYSKEVRALYPLGQFVIGITWLNQDGNCLPTPH